MLGKPRTDVRNRIIYAAWKAGAPIEQLQSEFGLTGSRIRAILAEERHKIAVSPDPIYCRLRESLNAAQEQLN